MKIYTLYLYIAKSRKWWDPKNIIGTLNIYIGNEKETYPKEAELQLQVASTALIGAAK